MSSSAADWSSLPAELLQTIAGDLKTIPDYIHFRSVCRLWRAAAELRPRFVPQEFPRLMLPLDRLSDRCRFFNPLTNRRQYGCPLPDPSASYCCIGSSLGRLILIDGSLDMFVLNPITGEKTSLPPLSSLPLSWNTAMVIATAMSKKYSPGYVFSLEDSLKDMQAKLLIKVILTPPNSPDPNNLSAFAISYRFNHVAYCKHGDPSWRRIDDDGTLGTYEDAIYFKGRLYLVNRQRSLAICDFNEHDTPIMYSITGDKRIVVVGDLRKYLLDVGGELLLVERCLEWCEEWKRPCGFRTVMFRVFKFDWSAQEWKPVTSLRDSVLFVGYNSSFAVTASEYSGCKGNRIYFTGHYDKYTHDYHVGVYNLDDGIIERIHLYDRTTQMICYAIGCSPVTVWFTPSLW